MMAPESTTRCVSFWGSVAAAGEKPPLAGAACFLRLRPVFGTVVAVASTAAPVCPPTAAETSALGAMTAGVEGAGFAEGGDGGFMTPAVWCGVWCSPGRMGGRGLRIVHEPEGVPGPKKRRVPNTQVTNTAASSSQELGVGKAEAATKMLALTGVERSYASAIGQTMQNLTVQAEVGAAMESMLGDLEAWEWANKEEVLKKELEHARGQIQALKNSERGLLEVRSAAGRTLPVCILRTAGVVITLLFGVVQSYLLVAQQQARSEAVGDEISHLFARQKALLEPHVPGKREGSMHFEESPLYSYECV